MSTASFRWTDNQVATDERKSPGKVKGGEGTTRRLGVRRSGSAMEPALRLHRIGCEQYRTGAGLRGADLSSLVGPALVRALVGDGRSSSPTRRSRSDPSQGNKRQPHLATGCRVDRVRQEWSSGIRLAVIGVDGGLPTNTGGAEEAARLLSELGWSTSTWSTRASQVAKWLRFCDEDMRTPLPASEHDVLAYVGYLALEGKISADFLLQYLSAVSQYHELHHLQSPTKTPMVRALVHAYRRHMDIVRGTTAPVRIGCSAGLMREVVRFGCSTVVESALSCCAMVVMAFIFQVRAVSMHHVTCKDMVFSEDVLEVSFYRRKGKSIRRPLILRYNYSGDWPVADNPMHLLRKWHTNKPLDSSFANSLPDSIHRVLALLQVVAPDNCHYSGHSPCIGGYNGLSVLGFPKEWIMRRLDWETEAMMRVYHDSHILRSVDSGWFFARLR